MEIWVDALTGHITTSTNGVVTKDVSDFLPADSSSGLKVKIIGFDASESSYYPTMITELDDIYIGVTRARVELSNSATWRPSGHREIQPVSSWAGNKITAKISKGGLASLESSYIFIIDADNQPSTGYKLSCGPESESAPEAPDNLTIKKIGA